MNTRQEFEAWAKPLMSVMRYVSNDEYLFNSTAKAWLAWQAATSRQEAKVTALVEALEHALSWFDDKEPVHAWVVDAQNALAAKETS